MEPNGAGGRLWGWMVLRGDPRVESPPSDPPSPSWWREAIRCCNRLSFVCTARAVEKKTKVNKMVMRKKTKVKMMVMMMRKKTKVKKMVMRKNTKVKKMVMRRRQR